MSARPDHTEKCNAQQMTVVHIEGMEAVQNMDEILEADGIDVIFLGPYDLSQSLGVTGQVDDPRVRGALESCAQKALDAGRFVGSYAKDADMAAWLVSIGVQYIAAYVDAAAVSLFYSRLLDDLRRAL